MTSQPYTIETQGLSRSFKSYTKAEGISASFKGFFNRQHVVRQALKPTTLQIRGGQIVGLVGSNGAGKTTLLKLLSGLIHPTEGEARVLGFNPKERPRELLQQMSLLLGQKAQLWWDLTPTDSYRLLAEIYGIERAVAEERVRSLADRLKCTHVLSTQLRRLSLGERMKMEMIGALVHQPKILFLDEPTIGLDIVAQGALREFLKSYVKDYQPTVILTSHYMDDISFLADQLLLISQGEIVYNGTVREFTLKTGSAGFNESMLKVSWPEPLKQSLDLGEGTIVKAGESFVEVKIKPKDLVQALKVLTSGPTLQSLKVEESDFESVIHQFLKNPESHAN